MAKQSALGTGLGALIGATPKKKRTESANDADPAAPAYSEDAVSESDSGGEVVVHVPVSRVIPSPLQPRRTFRDDQLEELTNSIREHGVIQPLIARRTEDERLEIIAGERRWRACERLGLEEVPVIVREASDGEVLEMALIENLQREDLNPIEEAEAYVRLSRDFELRQEDIARRVGKSRAAVANTMRLVDLDADAKDHLAQGRLSVGHAKVLLSLKDSESQRLIADKIVRRSLTVRAAQGEVNRLLKPSPGEEGSGKPTNPANVSSAIAHLQNVLREHFATQVRIRHGDRKGRIEIEYYGNDDLERILEVMGVDDGDVSL